MELNGKKWYQEAWRGVSGLAVAAAYVLCVIGATGVLLSDGRFLFAAAEVAVAAFAFAPVRDYIKKTLL